VNNKKVLNGNNNNRLKDKNKAWNENTLIFTHGERKAKILETIHRTKYTTTTIPITKYRTTVTDQNTSHGTNTGIITSNQRSKLLKINSDKSWVSTEKN